MPLGNLLNVLPATPLSAPPEKHPWDLDLDNDKNEDPNLKAMQEIEPPKWDLDKPDQFQRLINGPLNGTPETIHQTVELLESSGLVGAHSLFEDPAFKKEIERQGSRYLINFLTSMDWLDVDGPKVPEARQRLRNGFIALAAFTHTPVFGHVREQISESAIKGLLTNYATRAREQGGDTSGLDAQMSEIMSWDTGAFDEVYKYAHYRSLERPQNEFDKQLFNFFETGKLVSGIRGSGNLPQMRASARDRMDAVSNILGKDAHKLIEAEFQKRKIGFIFGQIGIDPQTWRPGFSTDGSTFTPFIPDGSLKTFADAKAAQVQVVKAKVPTVLQPEPILYGQQPYPGPGYVPRRMIPTAFEERPIPSEAAKRVLEIVPETRRQYERELFLGGPERAQKYLRTIAPAVFQYWAEKAVPSVVLPQGEEGLTPYERERAGTVIATMADVGHFIERMGENLTRDTKALDRVVGSTPTVSKILGNVGYMYGGESMAAATDDSPGEMLKTFCKKVMDDSIGSAQIDVMKRWPGFKDVTPGEWQGLLDASNNAVDAYMQYYSRSFETQAKYMEDLHKQLTDPKELLKNPFGFASKVLWLGGAQLAHGMAMPLSFVVDDPAKAPGFLAAGLGLGKFQRLVREGYMHPIRRCASAIRLKNAGLQIGYLAPQEAMTLRTAAQRVLHNAMDAGDISLTTKMEGVAAVLEGAVESFQRTGIIPNARGFARTVAGAWHDLASEAGILGQTVLEKTIPTSFMEKVRAAGNVLGMTPKRLDRGIQVALSKTPYTESVRALRSITGAGAEAEEWASRITRREEQLGRGLRPDERAELMPDSVANMNGLLINADRINLKDGIIQRAYQKVFGWKGVNRLPQLVEAIHEQTARWAQTAIETVAHRRRWGITRLRNRLVMDVARRKVQNRVDDMQSTIDTITELQRQGSATPAQIADLPKLRTIREAENLKLQRLQQFLARLDGHPFQEGWRIPKEIWSEVGDDEIEMLLHAHGETYGLTPETVFDFRRTIRPAEEQAALNNVRDFQGKIKQNLADLRTVRGNPLQHDETYRAMGAYLRGMRQQQRANVRFDNLQDPVLDEEILITNRALRTRGREIRAGQRPATKDERLTGQLRLLLDDYRAARRELIRIRNYTTRWPNAKGRRMFEDTLAHDSLADFTKKNVAILEDQARAFSGAAWAGARGNPFLPTHLPTHMLGSYVVDVLRNGQNMILSNGARVEEFIEAARKMLPLQRRIIGVAQRRGVGLDRILARIKHGLTPEQISEMGLYRGVEQRAWDGAFAMMEGRGQVPAHILRSWQEQRYDPTLYAAEEAPSLLAGKYRLPRGTVGSPSEVAVGARARAFQFKRDQYRWRLRIEEPDAVINKFFTKQPEALRYIEERYGKSTLEGLAGEEELMGRTPTGGDIRLAAPVSLEDIEVSVPIKGQTMETRLLRLEEVYRDLGAQHVLDALNIYGRHVLSPEKYHTLVDADSSMQRQFIQIPDNPTRYGAISGKYVHRSIIRELNRFSKTYENLNAIVRGLREAFADPKNKIPELVERVPGWAEKAFDVTGDATRMALITSTTRAWVANVFFNIFSDHLAGSEVFSTHNLDTLAWALKFRPTKKTPIIELLTRDPIFLAARERGLITGLFEAESTSVRRLALKTFGLDKESVAKAKALLGERKQLIRKYRAELDAKNPSEARLKTLERHRETLEVAISEAEKGRLQNGMRWLAGYWIRQRDALGMPTNEFAARARRWYNWIDEYFKLCQFRNLVRKGHNFDQAAKIIKMYSQNYLEIPHWLRGIPSPFRALVVSFPFEFMRIMTNAAMTRPNALLSFLAIPGLTNLAQMVRGGVDWERWSAIQTARGRNDPLEAALSLFSSLQFYDNNGNMTNEIDLTQLLPIRDMFSSGFGLIAQTTNQMFPEERRTWASSLALTLPNLAGKFVLNHPLWNIFGAAAYNRDPVTGQKWLSDQIRTQDPLRMGLEFLKLGAAHIIPPEFPGGRDFNAFWDSWKNAPINPNTGRPYRAQQPFTALARGITGMGVKGNLADTLGNAIGIGRGRPEMPLARDEDIVLNSLYRASAINEKESSDYPIVSGDIDERRMFYRTLDSSFTPEERAQAEKELSELLNKEVTDQIGAVKASTGKTERQVQLELEAMKRYGWRERYDSQALDVQCAVIALSDQGGVRDNIIRQMITLLEHRPDGSIANFNDPEVIRRAIGLLELRMSRDPYYNIRIRDLRDKLRDRYLPRAEQTYGEFKAKRPAVEMQRTAVKNFLGI